MGVLSRGSGRGGGRGVIERERRRQQLEVDYFLIRDSLLLEAGFLTILVAPFNLVFWKK